MFIVTDLVSLILRRVNFLVYGCLVHLHLIEISVAKQWNVWSDTTFCGVWSRAALLAYAPQKECKLHSKPHRLQQLHARNAAKYFIKWVG